MKRITFNQQHPDIVVKALNEDQVETALCIMEALHDHRDNWWDWFNDGQGAAATRNEVMVAAVVLDKAWRELNSIYGDDLPDLMIESIGCWDYEWIPAMLEAWMQTPDVNFVQLSQTLIEAAKNKTVFYVVNPQNHYFVVVDERLKAPLEAKGCITFSDIGEMYLHVAKASGLELEDVAGSEYLVKDNKIIDDRGMWYESESGVNIVDEVTTFTL